MKLQPHHWDILRFNCTYYAVLRSRVQAELFPNTRKDGALVRKWMNELAAAGLVRRTRGEVIFHDTNGAPPPVWYPTGAGLEAMATYTGDASWLNRCCRCPNWTTLRHTLAITDSHILLDKAVALQNDVRIENWIGEWEEKNPQGKSPEEKFRLFTLLRETPRLLINPDAAWEVAYGGFRKVYLLEFDRGTSGLAKIAKSKTKGYAVAAEMQIHRKLFPQANVADFTVLSISLTQHSADGRALDGNRRDMLRKTFADLNVPGAHLWKFVSWSDWTPENILFEPILYGVDGVAKQMIQRPNSNAS